jgi:outer membrane lipoprotein-sorting protein
MVPPIRTLLVALVLSASSSAAAETARELLDRAKAVNDEREPKDVAQRMRMVIVDSRGKERVREVESRSLELGGGERKSLIVFLSPRDVKGVGFLSFAHKDRDDDQWLYLPALKRVRRITASGRTQRFQGSDFTYEDLDLFDEIPEWTEEEASSTLLRRERVDGADCAVIALEPKKDVGYGRIVVWLDPAASLFRRIELYGKNGGELVKTVALRDWRDVGDVPTAHLLEMETVTKGTKTRIEISEVRYDQGLDEELFTERQLERGKLD